MPEISITPKSWPSTRSALTSVRDKPRYRAERNLARCVRRRLDTYSQLPVRCQTPSPYYRPPRASFKMSGLKAINHTPSISIAKSCPGSSTCSSIIRAIGTPRCKRSLSMIELSPTAVEAETGDLRSDSSSTLERLEEVGERVKDILGNDSCVRVGVGITSWMDGFVSSESEEGGPRLYENPRKAASLVCRALVLNAWRCRRSEVDNLRGAVKKLSEQVEHLHLQIVVLRRLLDTENNRVGRLTTEVHRARTQCDETLRERDTLKMENGKMENEVKRLSELSEERLVAAENIRNELLTAQCQLRAFDEQIARDRDKLLKLREDKRMLLEKVTASEAVATEREARAEKAESSVEDLQLRLAARIAMIESYQEQIQRYTKELQKREEEKHQLENRLRSCEETKRSLSARTTFLEAQLADREAALLRIESAYNSQLMELNELRERLLRQSQEGGWSSRMLQIAGSVVRAPRAILRSLSLFSTAGPPVTF